MQSDILKCYSGCSYYANCEIRKNHAACLLVPVPNTVDANYSDLVICQKALTYFSAHFNLIDHDHVNINLGH